MVEQPNPTKIEREAQDALRQLRKGNTEGFERLVDIFGRRLFFFLERLLGQTHDAEDALQETFATIYAKAGQQNLEVGSVTGWIYSIARNHGLQMLRRRQNQELAYDVSKVERQFSSEISDPQKIVERHIQLDEIDRALQAIPIDLRVPLLMRECLELSYSQIADLTGRTINQVASDILRARVLLREYFKS